MYFDLIYPKKAPIKLRSSCLEAASTIRSIFDKGKLSFGHALLRSVKSTHTLHFSPLFRGDDNVGEPIWVVRFSDDISLDELSHFFFYDFQSCRGELLSFLAN